jgi:hypothetical protein
MESESVNLQKINPKKLKSTDYDMGRTLGTGSLINQIKKFLL